MRDGGGRGWRHSLRVRFVLVFLVLATVMSAVFIGGMRSGLSAGWRDVGRPLVSDYVARLADEIGSPPDVGRARAIAARLPVSIRIEGPHVTWESHPGQRLPNWERQGEEFVSRSTADGHRITFGVAAQPWDRGPQRIGWITLAVLLGCVLAAYAYVRRMLRPLDDIRAGAERFGRGDFAQPIPQRGHNQLGELAQRINTMARDIEGMLDAKRALLLAVSHELRSPLTRARLNAELLPDTPEGAKERTALLRDLGVMRDLIADLLEGERLAGRHAVLQRESVDVEALVMSCRSGLDPEFRAIELEIAEGLVPRQLDRARIQFLIRNLLDNALRHSDGASQAPVLRVHDDASGALRIEVRDFGPGVAEDQLARLTEPFYRTDEARTRSAGGVGLGLYLCRLIAQAHGGSLTLRNAHPGLEAVVLLNS